MTANDAQTAAPVPELAQQPAGELEREKMIKFASRLMASCFSPESFVEADLAVRAHIAELAQEMFTTCSVPQLYKQLDPAVLQDFLKLAQETEHKISKAQVQESNPSAVTQLNGEFPMDLPPQSLPAKTDVPKPAHYSQLQSSGLPKIGRHLMPGECIIGPVGDTQPVGLTPHFFESLEDVPKAESSEAPPKVEESVAPKPIFKSAPSTAELETLSKKQSVNRKKQIARNALLTSVNPEQLLKANAQLAQECNALRQRVKDLEQCDFTSDTLELICDNFCHCGKCREGIDCLIQANHPWGRGAQDKLSKGLIDHLTERNKKLEQRVQELNRKNEELDTDNDHLEYELITRSYEMDALNLKIALISKGLADECEQRKALEAKVAEYEDSFAKMNAENNRLFKENQTLRAKSNDKLEIKVAEYEAAFATMNAENNRLFKENQTLRAKQAALNKISSVKNEELLQSMRKLADKMKQQVIQLESLSESSKSNPSTSEAEALEDTEAIKAFEVL